MGHRKYAELQEAAKQCEKTNSVRRSGRSTTRSRAVTDAIDDELQSRKRAVADAIDDWLPDSDCDSDSDMDSNSDVGICYATERRAAVGPITMSRPVYLTDWQSWCESCIWLIEVGSEIKHPALAFLEQCPYIVP